MTKGIWWKKEESLMLENMHNGIFEGCPVSEVPVDYLMFIIKCSKEGSNNPNTLLANKFLKLNDYDNIRHKAIDYKTRMILSEYEYEKSLLEKDTFYFNREMTFNPINKLGRINKNVVENLELYANDEDFNDIVGVENCDHIYYIDMIKRVIKYELKTRAMTLNTIVARNMLNRLNSNPVEYKFKDLDYEKIYNELSSNSYESYIMNFYMRYKDKIENNILYEF